MSLKTTDTQRSFRDLRAHFAQVCNAEHATLLLHFDGPRAIIVPLKLQHPHNPGPKDKGIAKARRDFAAALLRLHTR